MLIRRISTERPRQAKRFLTAREVEDMAVSNVREIVQSADLVITDAAREAAADMGIKIVAADDQRPSARAASPVDPERPSSLPSDTPSGDKVAALEARRAAPSSSAPLPLDDSLVRAIVDAIRMRWRAPQRYRRQLIGSRKSDA